MKTKKFIRNLCLGWILVLGLTAIGVLSSGQNAFAKSKVKTITVTKVNQKTAKKVHKQLMSGKKFKLRTKGNLKTFHKKAEKLMDKVAKCTEYRFDFYPIILSGGSTHMGGYIRTKERYTYCVVSSRECQEYIYGIKFAKQRHKLFIDYVDKAILELENIRDQVTSDSQEIQVYLTSGFIPGVTIPKTTIPQKAIPTKLDEVIVSLRELSKYLHKTKFYKLSEAMMVRIMLTINEDIWCKPAMRYTLNGSCITFKALYKNKAYGKCHHFALTDCKISAVFNIGSCDYFRSRAENHAVARVKVKTLNGKTKYSIVSNGGLDDYNDYVGYKSSFVIYNHSRKIGKKLKKINVETQELNMPCIEITVHVVSGTQVIKQERLTYYYIPRSEW